MGYIPCMAEVAIFTGVNSGFTGSAFINSTLLMFLDAL
jgi:hypothetical protein